MQTCLSQRLMQCLGNRPYIVGSKVRAHGEAEHALAEPFGHRAPVGTQAGTPKRRLPVQGARIVHHGRNVPGAQTCPDPLAIAPFGQPHGILGPRAAIPFGNHGQP